jgi:PPM family protein phosphatase
MELRAAGLSDIGKRPHNQDRILMEPSSGVFILADGMGGERCGDLAAEIAVSAAGEYLLQQSPQANWPFEYDTTLDVTQNRVMNGVRLANRKVWEACQTRRDCEGMGSTLSTLVCRPDSATIGNIGDSRVYIVRDARLRLLTQDDAVVANLLEAGKITREEAKVHPLRNVLTLALGRSADIAVKLITFTLKTGDRLLLSSDGLHGVLDDSEIAEIVAKQNELLGTAKELVIAAKNGGSADNISCIVIACV